MFSYLFVQTFYDILLSTCLGNRYEAKDGDHSSGFKYLSWVLKEAASKASSFDVV